MAETPESILDRYLTGRLSPVEMMEFESRLATEPELKARLLRTAAFETAASLAIQSLMPAERDLVLTGALPAAGWSTGEFTRRSSRMQFGRRWSWELPKIQPSAVPRNRLANAIQGRGDDPVPTRSVGASILVHVAIVVLLTTITFGGMGAKGQIKPGHTKQFKITFLTAPQTMPPRQPVKTVLKMERTVAPTFTAPKPRTLTLAVPQRIHQDVQRIIHEVEHTTPPQPRPEPTPTPVVKPPDVKPTPVVKPRDAVKPPTVTPPVVKPPDVKPPDTTQTATQIAAAAQPTQSQAATFASPTTTSNTTPKANTTTPQTDQAAPNSALDTNTQTHAATANPVDLAPATASEARGQSTPAAASPTANAVAQGAAPSPAPAESAADVTNPDHAAPGPAAPANHQTADSSAPGANSADVGAAGAHSAREAAGAGLAAPAVTPSSSPQGGGSAAAASPTATSMAMAGQQADTGSTFNAGIATAGGQSVDALHPERNVYFPSSSAAAGQPMPAGEQSGGGRSTARTNGDMTGMGVPHVVVGEPGGRGRPQRGSGAGPRASDIAMNTEGTFGAEGSAGPVASGQRSTFNSPRAQLFGSMPQSGSSEGSLSGISLPGSGPHQLATHGGTTGIAKLTGARGGPVTYGSRAQRGGSGQVVAIAAPSGGGGSGLFGGSIEGTPGGSTFGSGRTPSGATVPRGAFGILGGDSNAAGTGGVAGQGFYGKGSGNLRASSSGSGNLPVGPARTQGRTYGTPQVGLGSSPAYSASVASGGGSGQGGSVFSSGIVGGGGSGSGRSGPRALSGSGIYSGAGAGAGSGYMAMAGGGRGSAAGSGGVSAQPVFVGSPGGRGYGHGGGNGNGGGGYATASAAGSGAGGGFAVGDVVGATGFGGGNGPSRRAVGAFGSGGDGSGGVQIAMVGGGGRRGAAGGGTGGPLSTFTSVGSGTARRGGGGGGDGGKGGGAQAAVAAGGGNGVGSGLGGGDIIGASGSGGGPGGPSGRSGGGADISGVGAGGRGDSGFDAGTGLLKKPESHTGVYSDLSGNYQMPGAITQGDYDWHKTALAHLLGEISQRTDVKVRLTQSYIDPAKLGTLKDTPLLVFTGHQAFSLTDEERAALKKYVENGGMIWGDFAGVKEFEQSFTDEMTKMFGEPQPLPLGHEIYRGKYTLDSVQPGDTGKHDPYVGIFVPGQTRLAVVMTHNRYFAVLDRTSGVKDNVYEGVAEAGVNIYLYAVHEYQAINGTQDNTSPDAFSGGTQ